MNTPITAFSALIDISEEEQVSAIFFVGKCSRSI